MDLAERVRLGPVGSPGTRLVGFATEIPLAHPAKQIEEPLLSVATIRQLARSAPDLTSAPREDGPLHLVTPTLGGPTRFDARELPATGRDQLQRAKATSRPAAEPAEMKPGPERAADLVLDLKARHRAEAEGDLERRLIDEERVVGLPRVGAPQRESAVGKRRQGLVYQLERVSADEDLESPRARGLLGHGHGDRARRRLVAMHAAEDQLFPPAQLGEREVRVGGPPPEAQLTSDRGDADRGHRIRLLGIDPASKDRSDEPAGDPDLAPRARARRDQVCRRLPRPHDGLPIPMTASPKPSLASCGSSLTFFIQTSSSHCRRSA